jgi:phosphatidylglycerophosphate synthase
MSNSSTNAMEKKEIRSFYFSQECLENMSKFQYKGLDASIFYNYLLSPTLNYSINFLPKWVAPNLLTLLSLILHVIAIFFILLEKGNDFNSPTSPYNNLIFIFAHFMYIILDNTDGKQARRTNSSTSLGLLLDHGIDAIVTCLMAIDLAHMVGMGNGMRSFVVFFSNTFAFWTCMYEEINIGYLNLGLINGADEGNVIVLISAIVTYFFGYSLWHQDITILGNSLKVVDLILTILMIGSFFTIANSLCNIIKVTGNPFKTVFKYIYESTLSISIMCFPWVNYFLLKKGEFEENLLIIYFITSVMFCRVCIQIQCDIVGNQQYKSRRFPTLIIGYIIYFLVLVSRDSLGVLNIRIDYALVILLGILCLNFFHFVYNTVNTLLYYLNISLWKIPYDKTKDE